MKKRRMFRCSVRLVVTAFLLCEILCGTGMSVRGSERARTSEIEEVEEEVLYGSERARTSEIEQEEEKSLHGLERAKTSKVEKEEEEVLYGSERARISEKEEVEEGSLEEEKSEENLTKQIDGLAGSIQALLEDDSLEIKKIYEALLVLDFDTVFDLLGDWLLDRLVSELLGSKYLAGELIAVLLFTAFFSNLTEALGNHSVGEDGFLIAYILVFTILFTNFMMMAQLFSKTIRLFGNVLKLILPVYTLSLTLSGSFSTGMLFYEYFMLIVLLMDWICVRMVAPLVEYYLLLELLNQFSSRMNISKLCQGIYKLLLWGMKVIFFFLFGLHLIETMLAPSFDAGKNTIFQKLIGTIPGLGSMAEAFAGTAIGSALIMKNTVGVMAILILSLFLLIPILKIGIFSLFYYVLSFVLEPVVSPRFIECFECVGRSGMLLIYYLCMNSVLFMLVIAVTTFSTNHVVAL